MSSTALATKRVAAEIKEFFQNPMNDQGIFIYYDDNNVMEVYALIIGPKDTPYEGGFYFFKLNFPDDYPFSPPKGKFLTQAPGGNSVRIHPNLYTCGKLCLSILNTWNGPRWSCTLTLRTILVTIQSILDNFPLRNEPGFEGHKDDSDVLQNYNKVITYWNMRSSVRYWTESIMKQGPLSNFKDIVEGYYLEHYDEYMARLKVLKEKYNGKAVNCNYNMVFHLKYDEVETQFEALHKKLVEAQIQT